VLQADGGTRTTAITGAWVALRDALAAGHARGLWPDGVLTAQVAAVSVGLVEGEPRLDLDYREDAAAAVDCNLVLTSRGEWVEVQATGEQSTFTDANLADLMALGRRGIEQLFKLQLAALEEPAGSQMS